MLSEGVHDDVGGSMNFWSCRVDSVCRADTFLLGRDAKGTFSDLNGRASGLPNILLGKPIKSSDDS
jgi:hypothetical protein